LWSLECGTGFWLIATRGGKLPGARFLSY
jgi:hypothetical protein